MTTKHKIDGGSKHYVEVWGLHKETQFFNGSVEFNALESVLLPQSLFFVYKLNDNYNRAEKQCK